MNISETTSATAMERPGLGPLMGLLDEYASFSPEERALAAAARFRAALEEIHDLCSVSASELHDKRLLQGRIGQASDLSSVADVDLEEDIAWMKNNRSEKLLGNQDNAGDARTEQEAAGMVI